VKHIFLGHGATYSKRPQIPRDELKTKGWVIEDAPKGARAKRL
jgi:hypothetical protein